jgi:hypothetical protein
MLSGLYKKKKLEFEKIEHHKNVEYIDFRSDTFFCHGLGFYKKNMAFLGLLHRKA